MATLGKIRRMYSRDGLSLSEIARRTSLSRNTIRAWLRKPEGIEPKYQRARRPGKLAALINTLALITSSYFVVRALAAIRVDDHRGCVRWLLAAIAMGVVFVVVKFGEYAHHFAAGITLSSNDFYMFYLSLTFFHFMHVILGMVILAAVALKARAGGYSAADHTGVETGASYLHMVDRVWLILFPLVYMMR